MQCLRKNGLIGYAYGAYSPTALSGRVAYHVEMLASIFT